MSRRFTFKEEAEEENKKNHTKPFLPYENMFFRPERKKERERDRIVAKSSSLLCIKIMGFIVNYELRIFSSI